MALSRLFTYETLAEEEHSREAIRDMLLAAKDWIQNKPCAPLPRWYDPTRHERCAEAVGEADTILAELENGDMLSMSTFLAAHDGKLRSIRAILREIMAEHVYYFGGDLLFKTETFANPRSPPPCEHADFAYEGPNESNVDRAPTTCGWRFDCCGCGPK